MPLAPIDWIIILAYIGFTIVVGLAMRKSASKGLESFFIGDRSFPWWMVGISMVATTFAADTPLAITGIVAKDGISGNWFWWSLALSHLLVVFMVARFWRKSRIITDAELIELRYDGKAAAVLRGFKAFFFALVINCITMGWVIRAVGKITHSFIRWDMWFPEVHQSMMSWWPSGIAIADPGEAVSILIMSAFALFYVFLGGIRSVIITDLVQFLMALVGAIIFAWFAVDHVGGLGAMVDSLHTLYPDKAESILSFTPAGMAGGALFAFMTYMTIQWWAQHNSDGGGYFAQRACSAKDETHAQKGVLLFVLMHYLVRTWPWILVGLVALVVYPLTAAEGVQLSPEYARVLGDREAAYPVLIVQLLPAGLVGLLAASLIAAFMSTIDTHVNWGSSYLVNDVYKRFLNPQATPRQLVKAGRFTTVLVLVVALGITTQIDSIEGAWKFFMALGAGLGLPHLLRWVWWRISAYSELAGLVTAAAVTGVLYVVAPDMVFHSKLIITVSIATVAMLTATFATRPVATAHLRKFYDLVQPFGFWGPVTGTTISSGTRRLRIAISYWLVSAGVLYATLFASKELLVGSTWLGAGLLAVCVGLWAIIIRKTGEVR